MTSKSLADQSAVELVDRYIRLGLQQSEAADVIDTPRYNRLAVKVSEVARELKTRTLSGRNPFASLLEHTNMQVRFNVATHLMATDPNRARKHIETIAASRHDPTAGIAGTYLIMLDLR